MSETDKNFKPDVGVVAGDVKPVVYVARENVRNNVKACKPEMPDIRESKRDIQNRIKNYYTLKHPDAGYAEAGKAFKIRARLSERMF